MELRDIRNVRVDLVEIMVEIIEISMCVTLK